MAATSRCSDFPHSAVHPKATGANGSDRYTAEDYAPIRAAKELAQLLRMARRGGLCPMSQRWLIHPGSRAHFAIDALRARP